jgi:geranylgeranyl diphosphate synthase type II
MASTAADPLPATSSELLPRIERSLGATLDGFAGADGLPEGLLAACRHATLGGGKRLRPLLTLHACAACGGREADAMPAAVAIEFVHCFSLVHDDLPALDNDRLRRGLPTVHVAFGEAMAILAGDALMSLAVEVAAGSPRRGGEIVRELARATTRMIHGQVLDTLSGEGVAGSPAERLERIHRHKTGALIEASCRMGALAADADATRLAAMGRYGAAIGLMFQIVDDLLDETQSAEHVGKAVGKDREAGKLTYPAVHGLDASRRQVGELHEAAVAAIRPFGDAARPLVELAGFLASRTR